MSIEARRHRPRRTLDQTAYVTFGSGKRAIVVDVSEAGLRFETASPFEKVEAVRFWLDADHRSEGTAKLAWISDSRTVGGLHFTSVPPEIRGQIRGWIDSSEQGPAMDSHASRRTVERSVNKSSSAVMALVEEKGEVLSETLPAGKAAESAAKLDTGSFHAGEPGPLGNGLVFDAKSNSLSMFPPQPTMLSEHFPAAREGSPAHKFATTVLVILFALVAIVAVLSYLYPGQMLRDMSRFEDKVTKFINPSSKQPTPNLEPASIGPVRSPSDSVLSPPDNTAGTGYQADVPHPDANQSASQSNQAKEERPAEDQDHDKLANKIDESAQTRNNSEADLSLAQSYLGDASTPEENAKAVQLLWLATEKGNVNAEIELADLYSRGVTVQKSCVQARILLKAAAAVNPEAAQQKLQDLDKSGCS